jgi:hypothetical protein
MVNKAKGALAAVKRWSKEFNDPYVTKLLYTSLVRPILEYGSILWNPLYNTLSDRIESVQKQFLLFALRNLRWSSEFRLPPYSHRLKLINLPMLMNRRLMLGVVFLNNLLNGNVDTSYLLSCIKLNVPIRVSRNFLTLKVDFCRYNYLCNEPLRRMCEDFNRHYNLFSIGDNSYTVKKSMLCHFNESFNSTVDT